MSPCMLAPARRARRGPAPSGRSRGAAMSRAACWTATGMHAAGALDDLGVHQRRRAARRRRWRTSPAAAVRGAALRCRSRQKRQREVGLQRALVHLVEDHAGHAVQAGIGLQAADQQALGDHLDAGGGGDGAVEPGAVADGVADRLAAQRRHARRRGAGGQPARLQHDDAAAAEPGASSRASGTSVVLPAPGGATSTALRPPRSVSSRAGSTAVTGSSTGALTQRPIARNVPPCTFASCEAYAREFQTQRRVTDGLPSCP